MSVTHFQSDGTHYTVCGLLITSIVMGENKTATCEECWERWEADPVSRTWPLPPIAVA